MTSKPNPSLKKNLKTILQIHDHLQQLNGFENPHRIEDFIRESERNELLIRENQEDIELRICLKNDLLKKFGNLELPEDFHLSGLQDFGVLIEELSHFNTYCHRALEEREISALELEVQGEVDKFGLMLEWLHQKNESHLKDIVFDQLFGNFKIGSWVSDSEVYRYQDAHQIAKNFCRGLLNSEFKQTTLRNKLREFFLKPASKKLNSIH